MIWNWAQENELFPPHIEYSSVFFPKSHSEIRTLAQFEGAILPCTETGRPVGLHCIWHKVGAGPSLPMVSLDQCLLNSRCTFKETTWLESGLRGLGIRPRMWPYGRIPRLPSSLAALLLLPTLPLLCASRLRMVPRACSICTPRPTLQAVLVSAC